MPAIQTLARAVRHHVLRSIGSIMALLLLLSATAGTYSPAEATNWSRHIAATRSRQIGYEAAMRAADQSLRSLARAGRRAHRELARSRRHLRGSRQRHADARARYRATVAQLRGARLVLAATHEAPPSPFDLAARSLPPSPPSLQGLSVPRDADVGDAGSVDLEAGLSLPAVLAGLTPPAGETLAALPALPASEDTTRVDTIASVDPMAQATELALEAAPVEVSAAEMVDTLERTARKDQRALSKASQRLRRLGRSQHARARNAASVRWSRRAAISRREGAEAGLASAILSMSQLAQRRVAKKTSVRPGRNSSFAWPAQGRITQTYGCTGFRLEPWRGSCRHFHDGIDIAGYQGTAIRAAAVGVVSYIGWNPWDQQQRAFIIVVAHPSGYETLYGHALPTRRVRVGQLVRRGEVIGYMGDTGRSSGVHLHLELRRGRVTLNPLGFL